MSSIKLQNHNLSAVVATKGAWLERFDNNGAPLLFPKTSYTVDGASKLRGGCHVCLPNFGPGGDSSLAQHGFGRELEWEVTAQGPAYVILALSAGTGEYESLKARLTYILEPTGIHMQLTASNKSDETMRVSPGFHPYFATNKLTQTEVDKGTYQLNELSEPTFLTTEPSQLKLGHQAYQLEAENLPQWVLWTDRLGDYVCLEPTQAGFSFLREPVADELLIAGQTRSWSFQITPQAQA